MPALCDPRAVQGRPPESDDQALELTFRSLVHALRALNWQDQMSPEIRIVDYYRNFSLSTNTPSHAAYRLSKTMAVTATPLPWPVQPSFSVVVALTLILLSATLHRLATLFLIRE